MTETTHKQTPLVIEEREQKTVTTQFDGDVFTTTWPIGQEEYLSTVDGVKNPWYKWQIITGNNATTPLSGRSYEVVNDEAFDLYMDQSTTVSGYPVRNYTRLGRSTGKYKPDPMSTLESLMLSIPTDSANDVALGKLSSATQDANSSFQGATALAEFAETITMLRNPAKALRTGVSKYLEVVKRNGRKWKRQGAKVASKALAGTWLEHQFGWKPLISDIQEAKTAIKESYSGGLDDRVWAHGVGEDYGSLNKSRIYSMPTYPYLDQYRRYRYYTKIIYSSYLGSRTISPPIKTDLGFHPRDWLPALWEVVPWSFLVDYFVNIDDIISASMYSQTGVKFTNKTTVRVLTSEIQTLGFHKGPTLTYTDKIIQTGNFGALTLLAKDVSRGVYYGSYIPGLRFQIPGLNRKWLNMAALGTLRQEALRALR